MGWQTCFHSLSLARSLDLRLASWLRGCSADARVCPDARLIDPSRPPRWPSNVSHAPPASARPLAAHGAGLASRFICSSALVGSARQLKPARRLERRTSFSSAPNAPPPPPARRRNSCARAPRPIITQVRLDMPIGQLHALEGRRRQTDDNEQATTGIWCLWCWLLGLVAGWSAANNLFTRSGAPSRTTQTRTWRPADSIARNPPPNRLDSMMLFDFCLRHNSFYYYCLDHVQALNALAWPGLA